MCVENWVDEPYGLLAGEETLFIDLGGEGLVELTGTGR